MNSSDVVDEAVYMVVVNHEEQYSIWPSERKLPAGWQPVGKKGTREECLSYVEEIWADMRPLSLRKIMAVSAKNVTPSSVNVDEK